MRIVSLTIQAFRGFNQAVKFEFNNADMILIYGPNGHGKTSIYDAIEWGLTGGIHRFEESSAERNRTRFIKNLHNKTSKTFVEVEIYLKDGSTYYIKRQNTSKNSDRTDYGKHRLKIYDTNHQLYLEENEAEEKLKEWLVEKEWRNKVDSTTKMMGLTHILSQEKISEFLRSTQEKDRYDSISTIFGTDYLVKYREGFRDTKKILNNELDKLIIKINEKKLYKEKTEVEKQNIKVEKKNYIIDKIEEYLNDYFQEYPELYTLNNDLEKLIEAIINNQVIVKTEKNKLVDYFGIIKDIKSQIPEIEQSLKERELIRSEENLVKEFTNFNTKNNKIEELLSEREHIESYKEKSESLKNNYEENNKEIDRLIIKKENIESIIDNVNKTMMKELWRDSNLSFNTEQLKYGNYSYFMNEFKELKENFDKMKMEEVRKKEIKKQVNDLKEASRVIKENNEVYNDFLTSVNKYMSVVDDNFDSCPACGTNDISRKDILENINTQQLKVNENLPSLEKLILDNEENYRILNKSLMNFSNDIERIKENIERQVQLHVKEIVEINSLVEKIQRKQQTIQQKLNSEETLLKNFENECLKLGIQNISMKNIFKELGEVQNNISNEIIKILSKSKLNIKNTESLDKWRGKENVLYLHDYKQELSKISKSHEQKIQKFKLLIESAELIKTEITDLVAISTVINHQIQNVEKQLRELGRVETLGEKLRNMIEVNLEEKRLVNLQENLTNLNNELDELDKQKDEMETDIKYLTELMKKSNEALSTANTQMFVNLKETIQILFSRINSHPVYKEIDLELNKFRDNNILSIKVSQGMQNEAKANAPYVFSSAQVNSIALSLFFAMSLKQQWSPLKLVGIDDPIQSMDEVNIISFIDLLRLFVSEQDKQIIISTHDETFYNLIIKKFRYMKLKTINYKYYEAKGPVYEVSEEFDNLKDYDKAKEQLLMLDAKS